MKKTDPKHNLNFSKNCIYAINSLIHQFTNISIKWEHIKGKDEEYEKAVVGNLCLYVYQDECQIQSKNIDLRYESYDYANFNELINEFIHDLKKSLVSITKSPDCNL